jgi:stage V sporulation protein R
MDALGRDRVEEFIDACLSLEDLIDPHSPYIRRRGDEEPETDLDRRPEPRRLRSPEYMDSFVNPPEYLEAERRRLEERMAARKRFPAEPERDVLLFLIENAPLDPWQRDVLHIVREEAYYFEPQRMTKIMNEGWASYWHSKLMTERLLTDEEVIDYADHHSGTVSMQPGRLNPYKVGIELFRDIEDRWNRGRFGKEYDECDSWSRKRDWDTGLGEGRDKIFEVRRVHNDVTFLDTFFTEEFCREQKLFTFARNEQTGTAEIASREFAAVKAQLLGSLTNAGRPFIYVRDANFANRGELELWHRYEGTELELGYASETLRNLGRVWGRPVHIETTLEDKPVRLSHDGREFSREEIAAEV